MTLFSQRYHSALRAKRLIVDIPEDARPKLKTCISDFNASVGVQRDPNDRWISNSSVIDEAVDQLASQHGWDDVPGTSYLSMGKRYDAFRHLITSSPGEIVFDFIELAFTHMGPSEAEACRVRINQIFDSRDCSWRIADGDFFKLDADFVGARLAQGAHDALAANRFVGAANEYAKARQHLASGDGKEAVLNAGKSIESVMKVMTGLPHANADQLIKALASQGYFDDLPESMRTGFAEQVMKTLPFLRNKLAGHGQGAEIVDVPIVYGELSLQLAAAFHNLLLIKHLARHPPPAPEEPASATLDDDIPF